MVIQASITINARNMEINTAAAKMESWGSYEALLLLTLLKSD